VFLLHEHGVKRQAGGEENEPCSDEAAGDFFEALDGREQGKYGAEFVEFEVVFLGEIHQGRDGAEAERAERQKNESSVQAGPAVGEIGRGAVGRVEVGHQGEDAHDEEDGRGERAEKAESRPRANDEVRGYNGPGDEEGGFVDVVDGAMLQGKAAPGHGGGVKGEGGEEEEKDDAVVGAEAFAPEENGVKGAEAVENHGEQEKMPVSKPSHEG